jgi:hypothetical protein
MSNVYPTGAPVNLPPSERALALGIVRWMVEAGGPVEAVEDRLIRYLSERERRTGAAHYGRIRRAIAADAPALIWSAIWGGA